VYALITLVFLSLFFIKVCEEKSCNIIINFSIEIHHLVPKPGFKGNVYISFLLYKTFLQKHLDQNFRVRIFRGTNFCGRKFRGTNFCGIKFRGTNFRGRKFRGTNFCGIKFRGRNFRGTKFRGIKFRGIKFH
jgi:uncharacterized protein YjbI with pentapeptide repeats